MKDNDIIFDFICEKMYKRNEIIIYAKKHITEYGCYYKLLTVDDNGSIRKYMKECIPCSRWMHIDSL